MRQLTTRLIVSAGDLSNHLACPHLTWLNLQVALGKLEAPSFSNPTLTILQDRGREFEKGFLKHLREQGLSIVEPAMQGESLSVDRTIEAMKTGVDLIYQANLKMDPWQGHADFLLKVSVPSNLGGWSYEIADTKLAKETRSGTILQISLYSQMIHNIQGTNPEFMHVITPTDGFEKETYRVADFEAYTRRLQARLLKDLESGKTENNTYPNPVSQCDICKWWQECANQRRKDDHLSLVAGLTRSHTVELIKNQINNVDGLAKEPIPMAWKPSKGAVETYVKLREQARVQVLARTEMKPIFELLELQPNFGLHRLPEPAKGDIFFDFEGDPYVGTSGIEYLFGYTFEEEGQEQYRSIWAVDAHTEKAAFETFVGWVMERWEQDPELHIYHYTHYEPSTLKRLMGKYATRENEIDRMLRGGLFVDLYSISRQTVRAGIETYSLKELEIFHGFQRKLPLREAALHLRAFEQLLESGNVSEIPNIIETAIALYNKEDCQSTSSLRNWLESLRLNLIDNGAVIPRPEQLVAEPGEDLTNFQESIRPLYEGLMAGLDADLIKRNAEEQGRWLLANMLDWYRREKKALWWEYFRILALPEEDFLEEKSALGGMKFTGNRRPEKKSIVDTYTFPDQDCDIRIGDKVTAIGTGKHLGEVLNINPATLTLELKKGESNKDFHPVGIFLHNIIDDQVKEASIIRIAQWSLNNGINADGDYRAARDLLLRYNPRTIGDLNKNINPQELAVQWIHKLDRTVLPIQGPPGAGKSHTAAMMILELVAAGKKVGITALSHKVITGLLEKVMKEAAARGEIITCLQKISNSNSPLPEGIQGEQKTDKILGALQNGHVQIVGGTAWLWAREEFASSVDVLFVDEAGQLSLIDTVAVSQAATNLVLLGDPQQLKQPQQGSHPEGTEVSALEHVLGDQKTIPGDRGIFLDVTWRMHPDVCKIVSELFYENRLHPKSLFENQSIQGMTKFQGAGLWYVPVDHVGNQSWSMEEVNAVSMIIRQLCNGQVEWVNEKLDKRILNESDIKVISPYNAQVSKLAATLPERIQVGTVDKFQGQEAPVIIFSMASSTPEDAPRGMEFLYSLNRLNVAVSRAKAVCILVASPKLFEPDCKNPAQMKLANAFCRYLELAK